MVKHRSFLKQSKILSNNQNLVKNRIVGQKSNCWSKIEFLVKNRFFDKILVKNRNTEILYLFSFFWNKILLENSKQKTLYVPVFGEWLALGNWINWNYKFYISVVFIIVVGRKFHTCVVMWLTKIKILVIFFHLLIKPPPKVRARTKNSAQSFTCFFFHFPPNYILDEKSKKNLISY